MQLISDEDFRKIVSDAIDDIPKKYQDRLENVAFIVEDEPTTELRHRQGLKSYETLLGLYEGAPLPTRFGHTKVIPDKITLFKKPLLAVSRDKQHLKDQIYQTIWHEVAHYFGLDHRRIDELNGKNHHSQ